MEKTLQEFRAAFRALARTPGFTTVAVLTLALGIGANTAVYTIVDASLLRALPYRAADELVQMWDVGLDGKPHEASFPDYEDWARQSRTFASFAGYQTGWKGTISSGTGDGDSESVR